jgi:hypothetical protein
MIVRMNLYNTNKLKDTKDIHEVVVLLSNDEKKRKHDSWANLRQEDNSPPSRGMGTDVRDGVRTWVSEWLPSTHPVTTSVWCVWTQVYARFAWMRTLLTGTQDTPVL